MDEIAVVLKSMKGSSRLRETWRKYFHKVQRQKE